MWQTKHISLSSLFLAPLSETIHISLLSFVLILCSCNPAPQRARHLHDTETTDSTLLRQMQLNIHMADLADRECLRAIEHDSLHYTLDDYGFWFARTRNAHGDSIHNGDNVSLHLRIYNLRGAQPDSAHLIADVQDHFTVGADNLPAAIARTLLQARRGEEYQLIAPWYTAYGVEGTTLIPPYTNLRICLNIRQ